MRAPPPHAFINRRGPVPSLVRSGAIMFRISVTSFPHRRCETRKAVRIPAHVLRESDRRKAALLGAFELLGDCRALISPRRLYLEFYVHQFRLVIVELNEVLSHCGVAAQGAAVFLAKNCCSPT